MGGVQIQPYVARLASGWTRRFGDEVVARLDGTLMSVDLSGFTRLSERLAGADVNGAEELNAAISAQFSPMIESAASLGGDVLQFGGDALLIWFEGVECERRAAAGARALQASLRTTGGVSTPAGRVRLRMSVGIASGTFVFATVGATHRELLVLGPAATETVRLESLCETGQILVCERTARALPTGSTELTSTGGIRLRRRVEAATSPLSPHGSDAGDFLAPEVRDLVNSNVITAEHRHVTAAFVHIPNIDARCEPDDLRELRGLLQRVGATADDAVQDFQVCWTASDIAVDGFKLLFFGGAPVAHHDDAGRVLALARRFADRCADLSPRIGVHTGLAFAADVGHPERRTFAILGDTVNVAARLCGKAGGVDPLASSATIRHAASAWRTDDAHELSVKGKTKPIQAFDLRGTATQAAANPIVGRDVELAHIAAVLNDPEGGMLHVVGQAGIGKSALITAAHAAMVAAGRAVTLIAGSSLEAHQPYAALRHAFPELMDRSEPTSSAIATIRSTDESVAARDRTHAAIVDRLVTSRSRRAVLIDQVDRLDDASRSFITLLLANTDRLSWNIVTASRGGELDSSAGATLELPGLAFDNLVSLARAGAGSGWIEEDLRELAASVDGNPLLFTARVRLPRGTAIVTGDAASALLHERLDRLSPAERRAVRVLGVAGFPLTPPNWARLHASDADTRVGVEFGGLVRWIDGAAWFVNDDDATAAAAGLARRHRRMVHAAAAELLIELGIDEPGRLARHYACADDHAQAWAWSVRAGREAHRLGASRMAVDMFTTALDHRHDIDPEEWIPVAHTLAEMYISLGHYDRAETLLRTSHRSSAAVSSLRSPATDVLRTKAAQQAGRPRSARALAATVRRTSTTSAAQRIDVDLLTALTFDQEGKIDRSLEFSRSALLAAKHIGDDRRRAQAHLQLEIGRWVQGHRHARLHQRCAEALFRRLGDDHGLGLLLLNRGANAINEGPWDEAIADLVEADDRLARLGYLIDAALARLNAVVLRVRQGRSAEARSAAESIGRTFRGLGWSEGAAYVELPLAALDGQAGHIDAALSRLAIAESVFRSTNNAEFLGEVIRQRGICLLYDRQFEQARLAGARLRAEFAEIDPVLDVGADWLAGHAALQAGDVATARGLLMSALATATERSLPFEAARVAWSLEQLGQLAPTGTDPAEWRRIRLAHFAALGVTPSLPPLPL